MKNTHYWIEDYQIDFSRNQVSLEGEVVTLPPKAMAVLDQLIKRQGEVLSFDYLLKTVWVDAVVSVNTLQRCVFLLRKAFADDSKQQRVIKTHAKQGYSLAISAHSKIQGRVIKSNKHEGRVIKLVMGILAVVSLLTLFSYKNIPKQTDRFSKVSALTSSDFKEAYGSYSPDGRFIVFQRNIDACYSDLWAKDLVTQQEFKLTSRKGIYGQPDWSPDGNHLVFVERNSCPMTEVIKAHCWSVNTLSFAKARAIPQKISALLDCNKVYSKKTQWLSQGNISLLQESPSGTVTLQSYNPRTKERVILYGPQGEYIYSYDYSFNLKQYAVLSITDQNEHKITVLTAEGKKLSSNVIDLPEGSSIYKSLESEYHPSGNYLVTATRHGLFKLYTSGKLEPISLTLRHRLYNPSFHPDGRKIIATEVIADTDNVLLNLTDPDINIDSLVSLKPLTIARSTLNDDWAVFQPGGNAIAFTSKRTGTRQLWLQQGKNTSQISDLEYGIQTKAIAWSPSGRKIATLADNKIQLFNLQGNVEVIDSELLVTKIMQWPQPEKLLVKALSNGEEGLYTIHLKTRNINKLKQSEVAWANILSTTQFIYLDYDDHIWLVDKEEVEIKALFDQFERPVVVRENQNLYGINKQRELWRYSLETSSFEVLVQLPSTARYISDVNAQKALITHMNEFRKELVEIN
jgi:DNA-binding winged helix-turn-helix (wHTH) protein/Tol biopolymer transport system component